jgi:hypothetical protein
MSHGSSAAPRDLSPRRQHTRPPPQGARGDREGSLSRPSHDLAERMPYPERHVFETSAYTTARLHPWLTGAAVLGAGLGLAALWTALSSGEAASAGARAR